MFSQVVSLWFFLGVADGISRCSRVDFPKNIWENEGVTVLYIMKNNLQNWKTHATTLIHLLRSLKNIDVNANLVIATDKDCLSFNNIRDFKINSGDLWNKLEHHDDYPEAYIIDRCGLMTYHIIPPWSLVKSFSFVKGAILSTFFDKPCGPCDVYHPSQLSLFEKKPQNEDIRTYPKVSREIEKTSHENIPPIEIIMKDKHKHDGNQEIYEYTEMELGNSKHHRHFKNINDIDLFPSNNYEDLPINNNMLVLDGSDQIIKIHSNKQDHFKHTTYKAKKKRVISSRSDEQNTMASSEPTLSELDKKLHEITMTCTDVEDPQQSPSKYLENLDRVIYKALYSSEETITSDEQDEKDQMFHHYQKLKNWINYII